MHESINEKIIPMLYLGRHEVPVLLTNTMPESSYEDIMDAALHLRPLHVVFLDTPPSQNLSKLIRELKSHRLHSLVRSNRFRATDPELEAEIRVELDATSAVTTPAQTPGCEQGIHLGEFNGPNFLVVAEATPSGFLTLAKAMGVQYPNMREDAVILANYQAPSKAPLGLTPYAARLIQGWRRLPPRTAQNLSLLTHSLHKLFVAYLTYVQGQSVPDIDAIMGPQIA